MKSVVLTNYGDPVRSLEYRELPEPEKPGIGQVLVGIESRPEVTVPIAAIYPLDEIKSAVAHALQGGKVLLEVGGARS